jgi:hypothetical protein
MALMPKRVKYRKAQRKKSRQGYKREYNFFRKFRFENLNLHG